MPDPTGFLKFRREVAPLRPIPERLADWRDVHQRADEQLINEQASRCMNCGVPYCHRGCPLGNLIPDWNDLVRTESWDRACEVLHATNNFPEFTGRLCPALCEGSCVLGLGEGSVTVREIELSIVTRAFDDQRIVPFPPRVLSGRTVAVVGSGPSGLAAAQQLARAGHSPTVYERSDAVGGLLGVPARDTLKRVGADGRVVETIDRSVVWQAYTPQMFRLGALHRALADALVADAAITDEASAMEWAGYAPRLVEGRVDNIKVTTPEDLQRLQRNFAKH